MHFIYGGNHLIKKSLAIGIIFLFIISSVTPMVFGYDEVSSCSSNEENKIYEKFTSSSGPMDSAWPMSCHDIKHTGRSPYSTVDNNGAVIWKFRSYDDGWIEAGIAIDDDGILYFGDYDWYFYAVYPNGTLKWKYKTGGAITSTPALADDGTIYIGSYSNHLYAFNPNGTLKWKYNVGNSISSSPAIGDDETIYFGTLGTGCKLYALNPNGTEKWYYQTGSKLYSDPAIGDDGTIYIGAVNRYMYAINPNGTLQWRFKTGDEIHSHPSIGEDGTIYFGSNDKYVYALYPNGTLKWNYKINGQLYSSASIGEDGTIYVPDHDLYAIYPNGTLKWQFDFGEEMVVAHSSPAISAEGEIYIGVCKQGMAGGYIIAVNSNGTEKWRYKIANRWVESSPTIGEDGTVYIGSSSHDVPGDSYGYLYALGPGNTPPDTPIIDGVASGIPRKEYTFSFTINDFDGDDMYLFVDWGDNTNNTWVGPYTSGKIELNHTWSNIGIYPIKAKVKDEYGAESEWATTEVNMPKNKIINPFLLFLERLIERFPILEQILQTS